MLVMYSKNSINLDDNIVNTMSMDDLPEKEILEEKIVYKSPKADKTNIMKIMNRLANLKIDVEKQSRVSSVKIDKKSFDKMINLVMAKSPKINSKYSYATIKNYLSDLKGILKGDSLSLGQYRSILFNLEKYEEENKDTVNPAVKSMLESIDEVKMVVILKMYPKLIKIVIKFKERMEYLITLYQNKMVFDDLTLKDTLDEMNDNIDTIYNLYKKYYETDIKFKSLYDCILNRKDTIQQLVSKEKEKGI